MEKTIDKIIHHIAFTLFWGLVVALVVVLFMIISQWETENINNCIQRGYSEIVCRAL